MNSSKQARGEFEFGALTASQHSIVGHISSKIRSIADEIIPSERSGDVFDGELISKVHHLRPRHFFVVSGDRGAGKSLTVFALNLLIEQMGSAATPTEQLREEFDRLHAALGMDMLKPHSVNGGADRKTAHVLPILYPDLMTDRETSLFEIILGHIDQQLSHQLTKKAPNERDPWDVPTGLEEIGTDSDPHRQRLRLLRKKLRGEITAGTVFSHRSVQQVLSNQHADFHEYLDERSKQHQTVALHPLKWSEFVHEYLDYLGTQLMIVIIDDCDLSPRNIDDVVESMRLYLGHERIVVILAATFESLEINMEVNEIARLADFANIARAYPVRQATSEEHSSLEIETYKHILKRNEILDGITRSIEFKNKETKDLLGKVLPSHQRYKISHHTTYDALQIISVSHDDEDSFAEFVKHRAQSGNHFELAAKILEETNSKFVEIFISLSVSRYVSLFQKFTARDLSYLKDILRADSYDFGFFTEKMPISLALKDQLQQMMQLTILGRTLKHQDDLLEALFEFSTFEIIYDEFDRNILEISDNNSRLLLESGLSQVKIDVIVLLVDFVHMLKFIDSGIPNQPTAHVLFTFPDNQLNQIAAYKRTPTTSSSRIPLCDSDNEKEFCAPTNTQTYSDMVLLAKIKGLQKQKGNTKRQLEILRSSLQPKKNTRMKIVSSNTSASDRFEENVIDQKLITRIRPDSGWMTKFSLYTTQYSRMIDMYVIWLIIESYHNLLNGILGKSRSNQLYRMIENLNTDEAKKKFAYYLSSFIETPTSGYPIQDEYSNYLASLIDVKSLEDNNYLELQAELLRAIHISISAHDRHLGHSKTSQDLLNETAAHRPDLPGLVQKAAEKAQQLLQESNHREAVLLVEAVLDAFSEADPSSSSKNWFNQHSPALVDGFTKLQEALPTDDAIRARPGLFLDLFVIARWHGQGDSPLSNQAAANILVEHANKLRKRCETLSQKWQIQEPFTNRDTQYAKWINVVSEFLGLSPDALASVFPAPGRA